MDKTDYEAGETEEERKEEEKEEALAKENENKDTYFVIPHVGDPRYTAEGLPILTISTKRAFMSELERSLIIEEDHRTRLNQWIDNVDEENPEVADFINHVVSVYPDCFKFMTCAALLELYHLLKSQIANNNIFDYFRIGEKQEH
ncbi:MAG: hypothetical protein NTU63_00330 [Candidatus Pacearchaeota archaeon]|nr:hypothetical protein [Candidatus Pacearchaeota archaeon]